MAMNSNVSCIDGRFWSAAEVAARCRITQSAARTRLRRWRHGELSDAELLHVGKRYAGGNPGFKTATHATQEWKDLDDSPRSMRPLNTTPGTWEREHLRPTEGCTVRQRHVMADDREHGERGGVYYNPVRVAL